MTRRHLHALPDLPASSDPDPSIAAMAAHEFLRKPRARAYPYGACISVLEGAIGHHLRRGGDPWCWTPEDAVGALNSWLEDPSGHDPDGARFLTDLLSDFIEFAHHDRVSPDQTAAALQAIERLRAEFLCVVGAAGWRTPVTSWRDVHPTHPLQDLVELVGDLATLERLDAEPLPDEPFDWTGVPGILVPALEDLVPLLDSCADQWLTIEHRTAMRRLGASVARRDPRALRRGPLVRRAAAIAWVVLRANDDLGPGRLRLMTAKDLSARFGLRSDVSSPARSMLRSAGGSQSWALDFGDRVRLGDARLLTSRRRAHIIAARDRRSAALAGQRDTPATFS